MLNLLQSTTRHAVGIALDGLHMRNLAIGANVANAETPNYKRVDVQFEHALQAQLQAKQGMTSSGELSLVQQQAGHLTGQPVPDAGSIGGPSAFQIQAQYRADGNGVDMDQEMAYLAQTAQRFMALSQMESKMYKSLRALITS
jgi:flagellar basal-body rod protein FlgB